MIWQFDILLLTLVGISAFSSLWIRDLLSASIAFGAYSFLMCLIWTGMGAVDVAFTEAAVGAGISTVFLLALILNTTRTIRFNPKALGLKIVAGIVVIATGGLLLTALHDLPNWGDPQSPANANVASYYINHTLEDTAVPNIVTAVLADYRAFDTMLETGVVFVACIGIFTLLRRREEDTSEQVQPESSLIIRNTTKLIAPFMQLFALYVVIHGHYSPGGGFQGGVILGASVILQAISYDLPFTLKRFREKWIILLSAIGVFIFAGIGLLCLLYGGNFLDYSALMRLIPNTDAVMARYHSMLFVEIGVALTVMASMFGIYTYIASDGRLKKGL